MRKWIATVRCLNCVDRLLFNNKDLMGTSLRSRESTTPVGQLWVRQIWNSTVYWDAMLVVRRRHTARSRDDLWASWLSLKTRVKPRLARDNVAMHAWLSGAHLAPVKNLVLSETRFLVAPPAWGWAGNLPAGKVWNSPFQKHEFQTMTCFSIFQMYLVGKNNNNNKNSTWIHRINLTSVSLCHVFPNAIIRRGRGQSPSAHSVGYCLQSDVPNDGPRVLCSFWVWKMYPLSPCYWIITDQHRFGSGAPEFTSGFPP